jgi:hypothetical protein
MVRRADELLLGIMGMSGTSRDCCVQILQARRCPGQKMSSALEVTRPTYNTRLVSQSV